MICYIKIQTISNSSCNVNIYITTQTIRSFSYRIINKAEDDDDDDDDARRLSMQGYIDVCSRLFMLH